MIKVTCECGASLNANDDMAGKRGRCPRCGAALDIPLPTLEVEAGPTAFSAVTIEVGKVFRNNSYISTSVRIERDGTGRVQFYVSGPGSRSKGEMIFMGRSHFEDLKELIGRTDAALHGLQVSKRMSNMIDA